MLTIAGRTLQPGLMLRRRVLPMCHAESRHSACEWSAMRGKGLQHRTSPRARSPFAQSVAGAGQGSKRASWDGPVSKLDEG